MRPVPNYLLKRISDDIEAAIRLVAVPKIDHDAIWDHLNEMRVYVNEAAEAADVSAETN